MYSHVPCRQPAGLGAGFVGQKLSKFTKASHSLGVSAVRWPCELGRAGLILRKGEEAKGQGGPGTWGEHPEPMPEPGIDWVQGARDPGLPAVWEAHLLG